MPPSENGIDIPGNPEPPVNGIDIPGNPEPPVNGIDIPGLAPGWKNGGDPPVKAAIRCSSQCPASRPYHVGGGGGLTGHSARARTERSTSIREPAVSEWLLLIHVSQFLRAARRTAGRVCLQDLPQGTPSLR